MGNSAGRDVTESPSSSGPNPLDTTFGPHSRRAAQLKSTAHGGILEIADSAMTHLQLSTVSKLGRIAEQHPDALKYFPQGSVLVLSAEYYDSDYSSSVGVFCELKYPSERGGLKSSGRESIYRSGGSCSIETAFEKFLLLLENKQLDSD